MALIQASQSSTRSLLAGPARRTAVATAVGGGARSLAASTSRSLIIPSRAAFAEDAKKQGILSSLLRGSEEARAQGQTTESHSTTVARGKYIHEIQRHDVKADCVEEYKKVLADFYPKISEGEQHKAKLTGSWEVTIGDLETFYHVWQYRGYQGYDESVDASSAVELRAKLDTAVRPLIKHRSNWICQEFAFWPTAPAKDRGGIYELRTYRLQPGKLLEWEQHWRKGLEARRKHTEPVGAWFTQIGGLSQVFHIWHYPSLSARKATRDAAWQEDVWSQTVTETVKLIDKMHCQIMKPLPFSPMR